MPVAVLVGGFSSVSDFAINTTGKWLCPEGTTPAVNTYATMSRDENGFEHPATGYELQCLGANGDVVKTDPVLYAFIWIGIWAVVGLLVSAVLTFIFAVPGEMLVTRMLSKLRTKNTA